MRNARTLRARLCELHGTQALFARPVFHEFALTLTLPASAVIERLAPQRILPGVALGEDYPELGDALLVCATETRNDADFERYAGALDALTR